DGAQLQPAGAVPAARTPHRVDSGDAAGRQLHREAGLRERAVREEPRRRRAALAHAVRAERHAHLRGRLSEADAAERASRDERPAVGQRADCCGNGKHGPHRVRSMPLWDELAGLVARIDGYSVKRREFARKGWTRVTSSVVFDGDGEHGEGEDVTWEAEAHDEFPDGIMLAGTWVLGDLSKRLDDFELPDFRRWAFESAALDLAVRQAGRSLGDV